MYYDHNRKHSEENYDYLMGKTITFLIKMFKYADMDWEDFTDYLYHRFQEEGIDTTHW